MKLLIFSGIVVSFLSVVSLVVAQDPIDQQSDVAAIMTAIAQGTPYCPCQVAPGLQFSGDGQEASPLFELESGLAVFRLTHDGQGLFWVDLLDSQGEDVDTLAIHDGVFDGSKAVGISAAGKYILDIRAGGSWKVSIEQ